MSPPETSPTRTRPSTSLSMEARVRLLSRALWIRRARWTRSRCGGGVGAPRRVITEGGVRHGGMKGVPVLVSVIEAGGARGRRGGAGDDLRDALAELVEARRRELREREGLGAGRDARAGEVALDESIGQALGHGARRGRRGQARQRRQAGQFGEEGGHP